MNKTNFISRAFVVSLIVFVAGSFVLGQTSHNTRKDAEKNAGKGIVFKTPGKFMQAPLSGFKGMLLLNPDAPAAIVISYPNENETPDALMKRLLELVPKFFGDSKESVPSWTSKAIEVNEGDKPGSGVLHSSRVNNTQLQLALFLKEWNGLTFAYGYISMRTEKSKESDLKKYWMDDAGRGVKPFQAFRKSFS